MQKTEARSGGQFRYTIKLFDTSKEYYVEIGQSLVVNGYASPSSTLVMVTCLQHLGCFFFHGTVCFFSLVKEQSRLMFESIRSPRGPSMYGINYLLIVCLLVVLTCSRTA